jgi:hypothetical protein
MEDNDRTPVTRAELKTELTALEDRLTGKIGDLEERLTGKMGDLEDRLTESWRDMQTELLKAFYSFAETNQKRVTDTERDAAAIKERLAVMELRLIAVEKRLNMPPAA